MKMLNVDITLYPKFAKYVKDTLPSVQGDREFVSAMQLFGHLDSTALIRAIQWGMDPDIKIVNKLGAFGEFTPGIGSNEIRISQKLVEDFEIDKDLVKTWYKGDQHLAIMTLLHELCHWGDDKIGNPSLLGEDGDLFEARVYGPSY